MTLEELAYLAEIIGVIIIVVTLLYLAIQVRQGAHLIRSESRQAAISNTREHLLAYLDNIDLFDKLAGQEKLSRDDQLRFSVLWLINMRLREHEWIQYKDGILDERTWLSYREIIRITLSSKRQRTWWSKSKRLFDPDFVDLVDRFIAETPESDVWDRSLRGWEESA